MAGIWALSLDYINNAGESVSIYLPAFKTQAECAWWGKQLWSYFQDLNGARELISSSCGRPA